MAGRHLKIETVNRFASRHGVKGLTTAAVAGTFIGFAAPVAFASPAENKTEAKVPVETVAATVDLASENAFKAPAVEVETDTTSTSGWDFGQVEVEAKEAPKVAPPAPATRERVQNNRNQAQVRAAVAKQEAPVVASNVPASGRGSSIVAIARQYVGSPYVSGGNTPAGWDCSGFVNYVYNSVGVGLPRTSGAIASTGVRVSAAEAQPGDIVYWPGHVGIYSGNGMHIAAQTPALGTRETRLYGNPVFIRVP